MKKVLSLVMVMAALLGLMLVPASAVALEGNSTFGVYQISGTNWSSSSATGSYSVSFPRSANSSLVASNTRYSFGFSTVNVPPSVNLGASGSAGVYISFFVATGSAMKYYDASGTALTESAWLSNYLNPSNWSGYYYDINGSVGPDVDTVTVKSFTPTAPTNYSIVSPGVTVNFDFDLGDDILAGFHIDSLLRQFAGNATTSGSAFVVPSFRVVSAETAADIAALENIADEIVAGNAILGNFYGDVMTVLNNMYSRMGSMAQVQLTANTYLSQIVQKLNDIDSDTSTMVTLLQTYLHYLEKISGTASDIMAELELFHTSFSRAIDYLVDSLVREFGLTRDAIEDAVNMLIHYLDSTFADSINPDFGQADNDLNQGINDNHAIEQNWTGSLSQYWASLNLSNYAFDGAYADAFMIVSLWFSNIFSAFGSFGPVLIFPMIVGICMLVLGVFRMGFSRVYAGHGRSKGGES